MSRRRRVAPVLVLLLAGVAWALTGSDEAAADHGGSHCSTFWEYGPNGFNQVEECTVAITVEGPGAVSWASAEDFSCSGDCADRPEGPACTGRCLAGWLRTGKTYSFTAVTDDHAAFRHWREPGRCAGRSAPGCSFQSDGQGELIASFRHDTHVLSVERVDEGGLGYLRGLRQDCYDSCAEAFEHGTQVTLTAVPWTHSRLLGWTGACEGVGGPQCTLTMDDDLFAAARFGPDLHTLTVGIDGDPDGRVTGPGIDCPGDCTEVFEHGTRIDLQAVPGDDHTILEAWHGCARGPGQTCRKTIDGDVSVLAVFGPDSHELSIEFTGDGSGVVEAQGASIRCDRDCAEQVVHGTTVTLQAAPSDDSAFAGWSGACAGAGDCVVTVQDAVGVGAAFVYDMHPVHVVVRGPGTGTVGGGPILCASECTTPVKNGTVLSLEAVAGSHSVFDRWTGDCIGPDDCTVTVDRPLSVAATFGRDSHTLSVAADGSGDGRLVGPGISCPGDCSEVFEHGTEVAVEAIPARGSSFAGWSDSCPVRIGPECRMSATIDRDVTATFSLNRYALTVVREGDGDGTVTGPGIDCGPDCTTDVLFGTVVRLEAIAAPHSTFQGWTGACSGAGACDLTVTSATDVAATFALDEHELALTTAGDGSGRVTGAGIDCGTECSRTFAHGTVVVIEAVADVHSTFTGWTGVCEGETGPRCEVEMVGDRAGEAVFTLNSYPLTVSVGGDGDGVVTGPGIDCGDDCGESYKYGTVVELSAVPGEYSTFAGWSGACSGKATCTITVQGPTDVVATFEFDPAGWLLSEVGVDDPRAEVP